MAKKKNNNLLLWGAVAGLAGYLYLMPEAKKTILAGGGFGGSGAGSIPSSSFDIPQKTSTQTNDNLDQGLYANNRKANITNETSSSSNSTNSSSSNSGSRSSVRVYKDSEGDVLDITNPSRFQIGSSSKASIRDNIEDVMRDKRESDMKDEAKKRFVPSSPFNSVRQNINEVLR